MGLFSHSVTQVATQVQRVIEDKTLPNSIRDGFITNRADPDSDGEQLIENVMEQLTNGMGLRAGYMYNYGKNKYVYGLPSSTLHSSFSGKDAAHAAIEQQLGMPASLTYYHFGPMNLIHLAWTRLVEDFGYNSNTNQLDVLTTQKGWPVYLRDMQAVVVDATEAELGAGVMDVWGTAASAGPKPENNLLPLTIGSPTGFMVDAAAGGDYVRVDISWKEDVTTTVNGVAVTQKVLHQDSLHIPMVGYDMNQDYHQARYIAGGKAGYWIYQPGTGTHPDVDSVFNAKFTDDGSFFPFGYFRFNKESESKDKTSPEYKSLKKLFKKINMDFDAVSTSIDTNPDIDNIEQAMMMMAVPANSDKEIDQRYLFDFFSGMHSQTTEYTNTAHGTGIFGMLKVIGTPMNETTIIIQDKRFKMALSYSTISKSRVAGKIGKVGAYGGEYSNGIVVHQASKADGGTLIFDVSQPKHMYRHQISETVYEEIAITNLKMTYYIWAEYTTTGDGDKPILMVPVDINITKHYSVPDKELLYARSLHYVFNSRVTTHLKWYQTGLFRVVLVIIAIIITFLSYGSTWESIGAALVAGTITMEAFIILVVQMALKYLITALLVKLFVKAVGVKLAFVVALVAALAGSYDAMEAGGIEGAPFATDLLQLSMNLTSGINNKVQLDMNDLLHDQSEFEDYMEKQTKVLESAEDLLNPTSRVNPMLIFGETPHDFYQRTVHSGNIGPIGIDAITSYVDIALRLPKLSDTLGDHA